MSFAAGLLGPETGRSSCMSSAPDAVSSTATGLVFSTVSVTEIANCLFVAGADAVGDANANRVAALRLVVEDRVRLQRRPGERERAVVGRPGAGDEAIGVGVARVGVGCRQRADGRGSRLVLGHARRAEREVAGRAVLIRRSRSRPRPGRRCRPLPRRRCPRRRTERPRTKRHRARRVCRLPYRRTRGHSPSRRAIDHRREAVQPVRTAIPLQQVVPRTAAQVLDVGADSVALAPPPSFAPLARRQAHRLRRERGSRRDPTQGRRSSRSAARAAT